MYGCWMSTICSDTGEEGDISGRDREQQGVTILECGGHRSPLLSLWAVLASQLLGQEPLPHTLKSFSENVPGGRRVGAFQPDCQHF